MIAFFRKIRRELLQGSKIRRYLVYAIGEISLIVIGIVLAVQINGWNASLNHVAMERSYMVRLLDEAEANLDYFRENLNSNKSALAAIDKFSVVLNAANSPADSVLAAAVNFFTVGAFIPRYSPTTTTFDDLASTGNLGLVRDADLREELIGLYNLYAQQVSTHILNRDWAADSDGRAANEYGSLKWDARTSHLYRIYDSETEAKSIRAHTNVLLGNAAVHYWVVDRVSELNSGSILRTERVAGLLEERLSDF